MSATIKLKYNKNIFNTPKNKVVESVNKDLDYIGKDLLLTSRSLAPRKSGRLVESGTLTRYKGIKKSTSFTVYFNAKNPVDGYDYTPFTHDATYNLGEISRQKTPIRSKFQKGSRGVGKGYLIALAEDCAENWYKHIDKNVDTVIKNYK